MFTALLQIKNYKLFVVNMLLLGMGIAVTVPYLILFATKDLGMTTTQYGLLLALAAISQFIVNSIIARFSDTHHLNRKILIITALFMGAVSFSIISTFIKYGCSSCYMRCFKVYLHQQCHNYASARNQSMLQVHVIVLSLLILFYVQCFHLVLFGPFIGAQLIELKGYSGLFGGTIAIILFTLILQVFL